MIKQFAICEVRATEANSAPFQIICLQNRLKRENESSLMLDQATCVRYHIPMSLDLVGRTLICSFESRELPFQDNKPKKEYVEIESLGNDDLQILSLKRSQTISSIFYTVPPSKYTQISQTLELSSFGDGDGMHLHIIPCPFYRFIIELIDEEYKAYNALSAHTVMRVNFRIV